MINKLTIFICVAFFYLNVCSAQESITTTGDAQILYFTDNVNIEGDQFLYKGWQKATLIDYDGNETTQDLNYDGVKKRFVSNLDDTQGVYLNIYKYKNIIVESNGKKEEFESLLPFKDDCYGRIVYNGDKYKVFEKFEALKRKVNRNSYGDVSAAYKFSKTNRLVLLVGEELKPVKRSGKSFSKALNDKNIKKLVKSEKLDLDDDEDIAKLFELLK